MSAKKFGTFAGVFTPSILTILGVIMYLRLGWVVGNAGLYGAIIIILVAHVISITTGLSISSIATDKKVGAGGVYYVLSRSLGLPIGGSIGVTLFVGTALSIALYLVGFAESFNAYFGLDTSVNGLRISGSIALWALTLLAFISTSIALKAQFFIMAAIAASLVAIFFGHSDFKPTDILLFPDDVSVPIEMVFAVFFPAVTGFTAGIAMSGDLKDPKKSIPVGTIAAIAVGLVVYIGLAIFIAYNIDAETLRNDYNILMKIALFAPAVVAGIWGATLSSALGGILGAPRILQAMSIDRITPQFFAKGKGAANEPINALILTVIIAQAGILIGELDMIARVVSMFYLAAYGFINLSFFLESWASTDFKPTFKVKRWIGALGFVATFAVMFKLDAPAMIASFVIMGAIYFYLARKELSLGTGDIWQSVWSNIIKRGLLKLEAKEEHIRNWKPNILLFSGGSSARPHLIEFAKDLVSNNGFVTNFDLVENPNADKLFPKPKKVVQDELLQKYHLFGRKIEVKNIYDGIQTLATTFGFSGIEPNTILLGWARNTKNPKDFARLTQNLIEQDYNVLFLDYDAKLGFGKYETIDIWWNQRNRNGVLMLNLARLLQNSDDWRNAKIRLIHVNNSDAPKKIIESKLKQIAEEFRVQAEIKIINNAIEKTPIYDLILTHSGKTDLILAGIPELMNNEEKFVSETNKLLYNIGTTLLVKASSKFEELADTELVPKQIVKENTELHTAEVEQIAAISVHLPSNPHFAQLITKLDDYFIKILNDYLSEYINSLSATYTDSISEIENLVCNTDDLVSALEQIRTKSQAFKSEQLPLLKSILDEGIAKFISEWTYFVKQQPKKVKCQLSENDLKFIDGESHYSKTIKRAKRLQLKLFGKASTTIKWRKIVGFYTNTHLLKTLKEYEHEIGVESAAVLIMIQKNIHQLIENFDKQSAKQQFADTKQYISATQEKIKNDFINKNRTFYNRLSQQLNHLDINDIYDEKIDDLSRKELLQLKKHCLQFPENWLNNQRIFHNQFEEDLQLNELNISVLNESETIENTVLNEWLLPLKTVASDISKNTDTQPLEYYNIQTFEEELHHVFHQQLLQLQDTVTVIHPDDFNNFKENQEQLNLITLDIYQIVDFLLENRFISPTINLLNQTANRLYDIRDRLNNLTQLQTYGNNEVSDTEKTEITNKLQTDLAGLLKDIDHLKSDFIHQFDDIKSTIVHELDIRFIIEQSGQLSQYIKSEQRKKGLQKYKALTVNFAKKLYKKSENFYLKLSDKWLQTEYTQQLEAYTNDASRLQLFTNSLSVSTKVKDRLPQYYQQLFGKKHLFNNHFGESRKIEFEHFEQLLANNSQGAILVTGNPKSGKTYFIEAAIKKLNPPHHIIILPATEEKTLQTLNKSISHIIRKKGEIKEILGHLPHNTLLVFENIEAWDNPFEETNPLTYILQLAEQYKNRLQFIFTTNKHNINVLNNRFNFSKFISGTVLLRDLSLKHIETILLDRHRTGGIDLFFGDTNVNELKRSEKRKLFGIIYLLSKGNIGVAMQIWLAFISLEYNKIFILKPHYIYPFPIIKDNYLISLIYLFYLNRSLTQTELNCYFGNNEWQENMAILINTQLVAKSNQNVYEIQPEFLPWIETFLQSKNIVL